jgi:broad specificity phosphatase PhoE
MSVTANVQYRPASITVIRHGQSDANLHDPESTAHVPPDLVGTPNHRIALTETGRRQARATGAALPALYPEGFDYLYFSPYRRTVQTKEEILDGMPPDYRARIVDKEYRDILLREQDFGYADVMAALQDTAEHFDDARRRFLAHRNSAGKFYTRPDNGDSWADVCQRTYLFLGKVFQANRHGANILIVSHAVTIATFAFHLERLDEDAVVNLHLTERVPNCGVARWEYKVDARPRWRRMAWAKNLHAIPSR